MSGTFINQPEASVLYCVVSQGENWWPNSPLTIDSTRKTWSAHFTLGQPMDYTVHVMRLTDVGKTLVDYYYRVGGMHSEWERSCKEHAPEIAKAISINRYPPIRLQKPSKGWESLASIAVTLTD